MSIGNKVWYSECLWYEPVQANIIDIEYGLNGQIIWVKAITMTGELISDYSNLFSVDKPVVYR